MNGKPRRGPTDEELRAIARWLARTMLEVERGHRPAKVLRRLLAPHLYHDLHHAERPAGAPPVGAADIGSAAFNRISASTGYAVVVIREAHGGWDALTMVLRRKHDGSWQFIDIVRASQHTIRGPAPRVHRPGGA